MSNNEDLIAKRRYLCTALRRYREAACLTQLQAAEGLEWSLSKLHRIEKGTQGVSVSDLQAMLRLYGVTGDDECAASLVTAARDTWQRPGLGEAKMPFENLMKLVDDLSETDSALSLGELGKRWSQAPWRIADAIDAVRVLRGERTYIAVRLPEPDMELIDSDGRPKE